jgi:hypothetical protein
MTQNTFSNASPSVPAIAAPVELPSAVAAIENQEASKNLENDPNPLELE